MYLTITNVSTTTFQLNFNEITSGAQNFEVQYSIRPDFKLAIAPIYLINATANITIYGVWSDTTYYVRAREKVAGVWKDWVLTKAVRTAAGSGMDFSPKAITHEKALFVVPLPVISWTADNVVPGYPVENLGYDAPVGWRSAASEGWTHAFTMQIAPEPIDTIALLMANVSPSATVTLKGATSLPRTTSDPQFQSAPLKYNQSPHLGGRPGYHALLQLDAPQSYAFWRIEITSTQFRGMLDLQHAVIGLNRVTKKEAVDRTITPIDLGSMARTRSGGPLRSLGYRMRREEFEIAAMNEGEFEKNYRDLGWRVGNTEPVLVVPNPKRNDYLADRILYGALGNSSRATNLRGPLYTRSFSIDSII